MFTSLAARFGNLAKTIHRQCTWSVVAKEGVVPVTRFESNYTYIITVAVHIYNIMYYNNIIMFAYYCM